MKLTLLISLLFLTSCKFPKAVSAFYAKEVCSCLFVVKQTQAYCHDYGQQVLPIWTKQIDLKDKTVDAWALWNSSKARFINQRAGCQLIK